MIADFPSGPAARTKETPGGSDIQNALERLHKQVMANWLKLSLE